MAPISVEFESEDAMLRRSESAGWRLLVRLAGEGEPVELRGNGTETPVRVEQSSYAHVYVRDNEGAEDLLCTVFGSQVGGNPDGGRIRAYSRIDEKADSERSVRIGSPQHVELRNADRFEMHIDASPSTPTGSPSPLVRFTGVAGEVPGSIPQEK